MLKGYKTIIVAALMVIVGGLQAVDWINIVKTPEAAGWIISGLGLLMGWLRSMSDTSIFKSTSPAPAPPPITSTPPTIDTQKK